MASGHDNLALEPLTMASDAEQVIHVTVSNLLYPVTKDLLHRVFYAYGAEKIYMHQMETRTEASVQFQSREDVEYARKTFHRCNIYDGCCRMDIHLELPSPAATSSNSASTALFSQIIEESRADLKELAAILQEKSVKDEERRNREAAAANLSVMAARTPAAVSPLPQFSPSEDSSFEKTAKLRLRQRFSSRRRRRGCDSIRARRR
uniref:PTBP1-like RNA recognition motif 2 domain-containing protein n=1 Tax=Oryza glumipatula TaxID=40148 RepID=A0A0E0B197_9ORYZ